MSPHANARTAVVHLVRAANGIEVFRAFLRAYDACPPGVEHELVLLLKGFESGPELEAVRRLAGDRAGREVAVGDEGLDLTAYLAAARELPHDRLCFLNSYAEPLVARWLAPLDAALSRPDTGLVGASGSWGSHRSFALHLLRLPNAYSDVLSERSAMATAFQTVGPPANVGRMRQRLQTLRVLPRDIVAFPGFPAPHVRTNAFMIERELLLSLRTGALDTKAAAYRFESGRHSLTAQVCARGLRAVLVGRDGRVLESAAWPHAALFWQAEQENLLVADNQTRAYANGTPQQRLALARYAWGDRARPG